MRGLLNEKKAMGSLTFGQVVLLILGLIVLVLLVIGVAGKGIVPTYHSIIGKIDGVLIMFGLKDGNSGTTTNDCFSAPASFELDNRNSESVTFEHCLKWNRETCTLKGFSDGSFYYYYPETEELKVKRKDSGVYVVKLDDGEEGKSSLNHVSSIYYNAVKEIYRTFGVEEKSRALSYNVANYIGSGMSDYFGYFGDLLIIFNNPGVHQGTFFMGANGRYVVFNMEDVYKNDLSWLDQLYVGSDTVVGMSDKFLTPLISVLEKEKPDYLIYDGVNRFNAVDKYSSIVNRQGTTGVGYATTGINYVICKPEELNTVYTNCYEGGPDKIESGSLGVLMSYINKTYSHGVSNVDLSSPDRFDDPSEVALLKYYLGYETSRYAEGVVGFPNPATKFNELLKEKGAGNFEVDGVKYTIEARAAEKDDPIKLPFVRIVSEDRSEVYYLRFQGTQMYGEIGDLDIFKSDGNQIRAPFAMFDKSRNEPIYVNRKFDESSDEKSLNQQVFDYFKRKCPRP